MTLRSVLEGLTEVLRASAGIPVKTGWISPNDSVPLITIVQNGGSVEVLGLSNLAMSVYEFQIDIWARSSRERDEIFEKIVDAILKDWEHNYRRGGWWSLTFYRVLDIEEGGVYRKTILAVVKEIV